MVSSPIMQPQLMISVLLAVHICHLLLIMVIWLFFLVKRIHSVCSELLVEISDINKHLLVILVVHCLVLVVLPRNLLYGRLLKRPSSSEHQVAQLRNMLRIMLALATLRSRKRHLSLLILTSDSVPHWRTQHLLGTPRILGNVDAAFKGAYVSKGVFSRMYTHDKGNEWRRYRPSPRYVNSIYGKIGGSAFVNGDGGTRKINVYGYYGDDRDPGTSGSLFGIGGGAESSVTPETDTVLFTLNGTSPSKRESCMDRSS